MARSEGWLMPLLLGRVAHTTTEAIEKITGSLPAFTRPRELPTCVFPSPKSVLACLTAYGLYNGLVCEVPNSRSQELVIWDFE